MLEDGKVSDDEIVVVFKIFLDVFNRFGVLVFLIKLVLGMF